MSGKVEYYEKYSVSPCPSRDYYGIKVHHDEVNLYVWKISHGPHLHPTVRIAKFFEFNEDKTIPDDIRRVFGETVLEHVKNIVQQPDRSLLTLPKAIILNIVKYLEVSDITTLFRLSPISQEVFSTNRIWEILYKRKYGPVLSQVEKDREMACGFQQLMKERHLAEEPPKVPKTREPKRVSSPKASQKKVSRSTRPASATTANNKFANASLPHKEKKTKTLISKPSKEDNASLEIKGLDIKPVESRMNVLGSVSTEKRATSKISKTNLHSRESLKALKLTPSKPNMSNFSEKSSRPNLTKASKKILEETDIIFEKDRPWLILNTEKRGSGENIQRTKSKHSGINIEMPLRRMTGTGDSALSKKVTVSKKEPIARKVSVLKKESVPKIDSKTRNLPKRTPKTNHDLYQDYLNLKESDPELKMLIKESMKRHKSPRNIFDYSFSALEYTPPQKNDVHGVPDDDDNSSVSSEPSPDDTNSLTKPYMISYLKSKYLEAAKESEKLTETHKLPERFLENYTMPSVITAPDTDDDDKVQDVGYSTRSLKRGIIGSSLMGDFPRACKDEVRVKIPLTTGTSRLTQKFA